ncbi:uncharacterized protein LOC114289888, partial [Camellia sinensis]|uniref:uncharacterized protein LOC114289888 n=1 Tax=Camellia sinensis TaxID=4442 RepID=UPI0010360682
MVDDEYRKDRKFESGLRGPIQDRVNMLNMLTYAEVLDKAILAEANLNRYQSSGESQKKRQNYDNHRGAFDARKKTNIGSSSYSRQEGGTRPTCSSCGKTHSGVCCWASRACFECGEVGHRVEDCPKAKANDGKKNENTSGPAQKGNVRKGQMRQGRVFALVPGDTQNAETVVSSILPICSQGAYTLNDSGSTHSFVSTKFAEKFSKANSVVDVLSRKIDGNLACLAMISVEPTIIEEVKTRQMEDGFFKKVVDEFVTKPRSGYTIENQ